MRPLLLVFDGRGIYCPIGDFYIDPWRKVERAVVTHAHSDHARVGMGHYWVCSDNVPIMQQRLGAKISITGIPYGQTFYINGVELSFHPAGHVPGSAQVRVVYKGEVWVAAGDYKVENDGLAPAFEPIKCHTFITESTFGLPIYRWKPQAVVASQMNAWWAENQSWGKVSILAGYSLGKIQRLLQMLDPHHGPIYTHPTVTAMNKVLEANGWKLHPTIPLTEKVKKAGLPTNAMLLCSPMVLGTPWMDFIAEPEIGMASGWAGLRSIRHSTGQDRGFVVSDHADWPGLLTAIAATEAERVFVTHGNTHVLAQYLTEQGLEAYAAETEFVGESPSVQAAPTLANIVDNEIADAEMADINIINRNQPEPNQTHLPT